MAKFTTSQKKALWALVITTAGGILVATINMVPSIRNGPATSTPAPAITAVPPSKNLTTTGNNNAIINAEGSTVTVTTGDNGRIADALEKGLPRATNIDVANVAI